MSTVATPVFLVVRRHVDLGRTRSMMCWPFWHRRTPPRARRTRPARLTVAGARSERPTRRRGRAL